MSIFCFYDSEKVHSKPSCPRVIGRPARRRASIPADHPADVRYVYLRSGIGKVVVPTCTLCWSQVFADAAWGR